VTRQVNRADLDDLVTHLKGAEGLTSVSLKGATVHPPGVWVQVLGFTFDQLKGYTINARLLLVVADRDPDKAQSDLIDLLNKVLTVVRPSGPITARTVVLPNAPAPLPGLAFPLNVSTIPA
jgi:hypothetical protein